MTLLRRTALAGMLALGALPGWARENHALLIGASTYPQLDERFWLRGPANDIDLVATYLQSNPAAQFAPENITVLADGVAGGTAPTLQAIRDGFAHLAATVQPQDFVYLHFSGHGSQAPALDPSTETDGLDELFLPVDIGPWEDSVGTVQNALVDDEIGQMIDAIRAKGADVWVVFDSCHSGTATRAAPGTEGEVRQRKLGPQALGIPAARMAQAETASRALPNPRDIPASAVEMSAAPVAQQGRLVAFFAAQTTETTPEKNMPKGKANRRLQGVFTYTLFETLAERPGVTYRQLAQEVLRKYSVLNLARSTPLFEGALDDPVFGTGVAGRVLQWPATPKGTTLTLPAGRLHGLETGAELILLGSPADLDDAALATYTVSAVDTFGATATVTGAAPTKIPKGAVLRKISKSIDMSLTVALPATNSAPADALAAAIDWARDQARIGPRITFVPAGQPADLRLAVIPDSPRADAIWFMPASGLIEEDGYDALFSISTADKSTAKLGEIFSENLAYMSKALNLMKVGAATSDTALKVEASLTRARFDQQTEDISDHQPVQSGGVTRMIPDDVIGLNLTNPTPGPVDINVLYVGSDYSISFMGNARLHPGDTLTEDFVLVTDEAFGRDRLLVIVSAAEKASEVEDLSFLEQPPLERSRDVGTVARGLSGLLDEAGFGQTTRAAISLSSRKKKPQPAPAFLQFEIDTVPAN